VEQLHAQAQTLVNPVPIETLTAAATDEHGNTAVPPAAEVMDAMQWLYQFGIPPVMIPDVRITLDPQSPFLPPGRVFEDTIAGAMEFIVRTYDLDTSNPELDEVRPEDSEEGNPFPDDPTIRHLISTVPIRTAEAFRIARETPAAFTRLTFRIADLETV